MLCDLATGSFEHWCDVVSDVPLFGEENCAATIRNKFYGDAGALHCLASRVADAAFINAHNLSISLRKFQILIRYRKGLTNLIHN
jgi:hypothetical protein